MKKLFFAALLLNAAFVSPSQTADEIIDKYIEAMGGKEKLNVIKALYMEGVSVMQNGNEVTSKTWIVQDKLMRREVNFGMGSFTMVVTDKEGWRSNPQNGGAFEPIAPDMVQNQQSELDCAGPLFDYAAKGHKAELIGKEDVEGTECYKIKLTLKSGRDISYFIDPKTWLIIRSTRKGGGMMGGRRGGGGASPDAELKIDYSDYRKTPEGYMFAHTIAMGGMGASTNYEKIEVNKPVEEKLYKPQ